MALRNSEFMIGEFSDVSDDDTDTDSDSDSDAENQPEPSNEGPTRWDILFNPVVEQFQAPTETLRSSLGVTPSTPALEILQKLITNEMIMEVCNQTNLYADEIRRSNSKAMPRWKAVTPEEFWVFLSLNLTMGILRKPTIHDYWTTNEILSTPFFPRNMSRNRFEEILRALHLHENATVPSGNTNRFVKLGSFIESLLSNCRSSIHPGEYLCLDESLMAFKGRLAFRQYNPQKRNRFGIKYFLLLDRKTNIILDMLPYQGKSTEVDRDSIKELGFGGAAVMKMLNPYLNKNHKLVVDNYFNSPTLAEKLLNNKTHVLGTAQKRRKQMPMMLPTKLKKGEVQTYSNGKILVERWRDRREVVMINTFTSHSMQISNSSNPNNTRNKPATVLLYNKKMGAIDEMDKMMKYYSNMRKTYKWYKKVFFYLVDLASYNAYRIACEAKQDHSLPYKTFLLCLIGEITKDNPYSRHGISRLPKTSASTPVTSSVLHLPNRMVTKSGQPARGVCKYCSPGANEDEPSVTTPFKCKGCNVWLCIKENRQCFELFHVNGCRPMNRLLRPPNVMQDPRTVVESASYSSSASTFAPDFTSTPNLIDGSFPDVSSSVEFE